MYWVYQTQTLLWQGRAVAARLVLPPSNDPALDPAVQSPLQADPYAVPPTLTFQVGAAGPHPDNYANDTAFALFSERLLAAVAACGVCHEAFPVTLVDERGRPLPHLRYVVFHLLEPVQAALDGPASGWTGDLVEGIQRLVLDLDQVEHRPIFICDDIYLPLMRDDVKQKIEAQGMTGLRFIAPAAYSSW